MSKYTEAELKDKCLAWGTHYLNTCVLSPKQEDRSIQFDKWRAERNKPAKKIIDLQPLIASGIDCEFSDDLRNWHTGSLLNIRNSANNNRQFYEDLLGDSWEQCRPRMNHTMFHKCAAYPFVGGECPLPEGFEVHMYWRDGSDSYTDDDYIDLRWDNTRREADIIGYKILGLADGYAYPWEQAE